MWECQADRLYETVAWETSQDPSGSRVVVQARTWGVGARVCGGGGGSDIAAPFWYLLMPPVGDHGQTCAWSSGQSQGWGNLTQKATGHWERGHWRKGPCPVSALTFGPPFWPTFPPGHFCLFTVVLLTYFCKPSSGSAHVQSRACDFVGSFPRRLGSCSPKVQPSCEASQPCPLMPF